MIQVEYTFEGLDEAIRDIQTATFGLPEDIHQMLSDWGAKYLETAKAYPFPKADTMRGLDPRLRGKPRFRDFWKSQLEPVEGGAALDIWNEHRNAKFVLFPTVGHAIPKRGTLEAMARRGPAAGGRWYRYPRGTEMRQAGYPLRWYDYGGGQHTQWSVWHPPMPGQPVHRQTWLKLEPELDQALDTLVESFTKKVGGL